MSLLKKLSFAPFIFALAIHGALARPATTDEQNRLETSTAAYLQAMKKNDIVSLIKAMPPQIMDEFAEKNGVERSQLEHTLVDQLKQAAAAYKVEQVHIAFDKKQMYELTNGEPYYAIPIEMVLAINDQGKVKFNGGLVALLFNQQWYFVRSDDANSLTVLQNAFPGIHETHLAKPMIEKIN